MRKYILLVIAMMTMTVSNVSASTDYNAADNNDKPAQPCQRPQDGKQRQRLTREQLAEKQASYVVKQLGLDEATAKKFTDVYMRNQKEVWEAMPPRPERGPQAAPGKNANQTPKTDAESEKQIKNEFAMSEKLLNIRQKYYKEYSKFLSQQQILRVYEIDRQMHERFARRGRDGKPGMRKGMKQGMKQGMKKGLVNGQQAGGAQTK